MTATHTWLSGRIPARDLRPERLRTPVHIKPRLQTRIPKAAKTRFHIRTSHVGCLCDVSAFSCVETRNVA